MHLSRTCHAKGGGVKAPFCVVVAAHASADGKDTTPVLRAGVTRVGEDEDAPRDRALLGGSEAGDVPAAALPPGAVLALERHGVAELRVGTAADRQSQVEDAGRGWCRRRGWSQGASAFSAS